MPLAEETARLLAFARLKSLLHDCDTARVTWELCSSRESMEMVSALLRDPSYRHYSAWAICQAAEAGADLAPAIPALREAAFSADSKLAAQCMRPLLIHWLRNDDQQGLRSLLLVEDPYRLRHAAEVLGAKTNEGDRAAVRFLVGLLANHDASINELSISLLESAIRSGKDKLYKVLKEELDSRRRSSEIIDISFARSRYHLLDLIDHDQGDVRTY